MFNELNEIICNVFSRIWQTLTYNFSYFAVPFSVANEIHNTSSRAMWPKVAQMTQKTPIFRFLCYLVYIFLTNPNIQLFILQYHFPWQTRFTIPHPGQRRYGQCGQKWQFWRNSQQTCRHQANFKRWSGSGLPWTT